jgi:hypothetical protein
MLPIRVDTWWDAIVAGVAAGAVAGVIWGLLDSIGSSRPVWWEVGHTVPPAMAGCITFCILLRFDRRRHRPAA